MESLEFHDLLDCLDHCYQASGRAAVQKELAKVMIELKAKASSYLQEANRPNIILSRCHVLLFSTRDHRRHCVTLAICQMPSLHIPDCVRELVDAALDIPTSKVVVTGSGSNMVAAFRTYLASCSEEDNKGDDLGVDDSSKVSHEDDFGECEEEHDQAFESMRRIGCFVHITTCHSKI